LQWTHENAITGIRAKLGALIKDLTTEVQKIQATVSNHSDFLVNIGRRHGAEIETLVELRECLENDVNTKSKETAIVHDMYGGRIKQLVEERVALQDQLSKSGVGALAADVELSITAQGGCDGQERSVSTGYLSFLTELTPYPGPYLIHPKPTRNASRAVRNV
jgi:hypothetical protein